MLEGVSEQNFDAVRVRRRGYWWRSWQRFSRERVALLAFLVIAVVVGAGLLAQWLAPYGYQHFDIRAVNLFPTFRAHHFFGTDGVGHDVFSRTLYSIQTSILIGVVVAVVAGALGLLVGALAGYYRGWLDAVVMWLVQFLTAIPALGLLFMGIVLVGRAPRPQWVAEALILYLWTGMARVVRASLIALQEVEYVEAARAAGASDFRIIVRHLIPNAAPAVLVTATALVGQTILLESTVEFFGYGFDPWVTPSLGALVAEGANSGGIDIFQFWWTWFFPALMLVLVLVGVNFIGDGIDEALNPAERRAVE